MRVWLRGALIIALAGCGGTEKSSAPFGHPTLIVEMLSTAPRLFVGDTARLRAQVSLSTGIVLDTANVTWSSSDSTKLSVDSHGLLTAVSGPTGMVTVTASYSTAKADASVQVVAASMSIWPDTNGLIVGQSRKLAARYATYANGACCAYFQWMDVTPSSWTSSDTTVATVDGTGVIVARSIGHARIRAVAPDSFGTAEVYVSAPPTPALHFVSVSAAPGFAQDLTPFGYRYWGRACGLTDTGDIYCWGLVQPALSGSAPTDRCEFIYGGAGMYHPFHFRCSEVPLRMPSPVKFVSMAIRGDRGCGTTSAGAVYCWGTSVPAVAADSLVQITTGSGYVGLELSTLNDQDLLLQSDGTAFYGTTQPTAIPNLKFRSLASATGCGILTDSSAVCVSATGAAQALWPGTKWVALTGAYGNQRCGLNTAGEIWCGSSSPTLKATLPTAVQLGAFGTLSTFQDRFGGPACGLTGGGDLYCFDGSTPTLVNPQGPKLKQLSSNCALAIDDRVYCIPIFGTALQLIPGQR